MFDADDVDAAVWWLVDTFSACASVEWDAPAGDLRWTCWETLEHVADDLVFYAGQLAGRRPPVDREVPFGWEARRAGGPKNIVFADRAGGVGGLLEVVEVCGGMLSAVVRGSGDAVGYHVFGVAGGEGFAAMGVLEVLVHSFDVAEGLGVAWEPPVGLVERVLGRLFPGVEVGEDARGVLLWATGRRELEGRESVGEGWRWVN